MISCTFKDTQIPSDLMSLGINANTLTLQGDTPSYITPKLACEVIEKLATKVIKGEHLPSELVHVPRNSISYWDAAKYSGFLTVGTCVGALGLYFGYRCIKTLGRGEVVKSIQYGLGSVLSVCVGYNIIQNSIAPILTHPVNFMLKVVKL